MPATPAGELKDRIKFERPTVARSTLGTNEISGWTSLGFIQSKVLYGTGSERRQAGVENATQSATFRCRAKNQTSTGTVVNTVLATDRIVFAGLNWDITGIASLATNPPDIEFTAVASRG